MKVQQVEYFPKTLQTSLRAFATWPNGNSTTPGAAQEPPAARKAGRGGQLNPMLNCVRMFLHSNLLAERTGRKRTISTWLKIFLWCDNEGGMWLKVGPSYVLILALLLTSCTILGKLFDLSEPQFLHQWNGEITAYLRFLVGLTKIIYRVIDEYSWSKRNGPYYYSDSYIVYGCYFGGMG